MGVFDDHKLEQLDWMTQMTETIDSDLNSVLTQLPDRIPITAQQIIDSSSYSYLSFSVGSTIREQVRQLKIDYRPSWEEDRILEKCFSIEVIGQPEFNLKLESITGGEVCIVKTINTLSDEDLQPLMGRKGIEALGHVRDYRSDAPLERLNEVLDILGNCQETMSNRSVRKKVIRIKERLSEIFKTNEWRIRDMGLANKVGFWIRGYIMNGNLADLTNFCKLKVMTHNNMPIYSVKEEK